MPSSRSRSLMFDFDASSNAAAHTLLNGTISLVFRASSRLMRFRCGWRTWISLARQEWRQPLLPRVNAPSTAITQTPVAGSRTRGLDGAPPWPAGRSKLVAQRPALFLGCLILQAVSTSGDEVVVFPPAYHAFRRTHSCQRAAHSRCAACRDWMGATRWI